jgi:hypothetical protein
MNGVDVAQIGTEAMALVDHLRELYGDEVRIGTIAIVVDVLADGEDGSPINPVTYSCSDPRRWVQVGLLEEALDRAQVANAEREARAHGEDESE